MFLDFIKEIPEVLLVVSYAIIGFVFVSVIVINLVIEKFSSGAIKELNSSGGIKESSNKYLKIIGCSLLGLIPGCGGAIAVTVMYKKKQVSLGALIAAFITTTGEGAFVLLFAEGASFAREFFIISGVSIVLGFIVGVIIDDMNITHELKEVDNSNSKKEEKVNFSNNIIEKTGFYAILVLGTIIGICSVFSLVFTDLLDTIFESDGVVILIMQIIGTSFMVILMAYYVIDKIWFTKMEEENSVKVSLINSVRDIAMIAFYVIVGILIAGLLIDHIIGEENFENFITDLGPFIILGAVLIGLSPGCSGFIVLSTFYIGGHIPFSALMAGSIATNGDAFFPLVATDRKLTIKVCIITGIIAFIVGAVINYTGMDFSASEIANIV